MPTEALKFAVTDYAFVFRFLFVGGSTALMFFGLTFAFVEGLNVPAVLASTAACAIAICYNYLLHYYWTFESDSDHQNALMRYIIMGAGGLILNGGIMYLGTTLESVHYLVAQIFAALGMVCWSLCLSYFWVFK